MQQEQHTHQPLLAAVVRTYRRSAWVFFGFAVLLAVDIALAGALNPDNNEVGFWIKLIVIFGGLPVWATWIGRKLRLGAGIIAAAAFLGCVIGLELVGALMQLAHSYPEPTGVPGKQVLSVARMVSGLYLVLACVVLVWETVTRGRSNATNTTRH